MYYRIGQLASMCLVHGGAGFHLLADPVIKYISGIDIEEIDVPVEDIEDADRKCLIDQVIHISSMCY